MAVAAGESCIYKLRAAHRARNRQRLGGGRQGSALEASEGARPCQLPTPRCGPRAGRA